jgi:fatty-acyl-CoA synthase
MHAGDLLSKRAHLTPQRTALVEAATNQRFTYAQLNRRANRMANWLRDGLGVEKGDRVSILAHNSVVYLDLLYGLAKFGAVFAPLNWRLTAHELSYIVGNAAPKVLMCGPEFVGVLSEMRPDLDVAHYVSLEGAAIENAIDGEDALADAPPAEPERPPLEADDTHCLLYTSGTTGRPKGATIPQRQVLWNCINTVISWGLTENDVSPVFTPLFHAGGLFAFMTPLLYTGGRIVLHRTFDTAEILRTVQAEACTVILGVPTIFGLLMQAPEFEAADFSAVRFWISGGAPLDVALVEAWLDAKGGVFRQGYGLTEVGPNCFSMTDAESFTKAGSVGKPILHSRMRLVDEDGREVPAGATGELLISGPHVCTGYLGNPGATAESLEDSNAPDWQWQWFHTGDMARRDEDGFYYIAGRFKDMIISGGENIYAAEVEAVFREHPAVAEAALIGEPDDRWGEIGVMVVVLASGQLATPEELQAHCAARLARFKVPKRIVFTDELPYSPYGKVEKRVLEERYHAHCPS